jgi:hypothetical protein
MHHSMQRITNMRKNGFLSALVVLALTACGGEDAFQGGPGGTGAPVASLTLLTSSPTIASDGALPAEITAFVRNSSNQFMENVPVTFSANSGGLLINQGVSDENGLAKATLSAAGDPTSRTITVTALAGNVSATVTVNVAGSTLAVQGPAGLTLNQQATYTVALLDAGGNPISGKVLTVASQRGNALTATSLTTDTNGRASFAMTATNGGNDTITVSGLGLVSTQTVVVNSDSFAFTTPAANAEIPLGTSANVSVTWTVSGVPVQGQTVNFATTRGTVTPVSAVTNASGVASATISATNAGGAVITATSGTASTTRALEFVATVPTSVDVQPSAFTISTGQSSTLTAVVRDAAGNLVKNRTVVFTLNDVTGGQLSSGSAVTDSQGRAQTVYTASTTTSANQGVQITATVQGVTPTLSDQVALTVARREVFISIGTGNEISEPNTAQYDIEYVVQVTDSNGNGVPSVPVSMRLLSKQYYKGFRLNAANLTPPQTGWTTIYTLTNSTSPVGAGCLDEDQNTNGVLDPGEDFNGSTRIEAGNIAAVSPSNVVTDASGFALVHVRYPQEYAYYLTVELSASTSVQGTEYQRSSLFMLPGRGEDFNSTTTGAPGPVSPFGTAATCTNPN